MDLTFLTGFNRILGQVQTRVKAVDKQFEEKTYGQHEVILFRKVSEQYHQNISSFHGA